MLLPRLLAVVLLQAWSVLSQSAPQAIDKTHNITYAGATQNRVESFQGIRFGQDTSGANRFKHPKPFSYANHTTVQATKAGAACPQNTVQSFLGNTVNESVSLSEDCLNLLVVRAPGTRPSANLPVMVWIYGGSDETGAANTSLWEPTRLVAGAAQKGSPVVYVAMNYRVNVFGFANSSALRTEKSLNSGLLDQRLALEWVQKNIAWFGGNPKNVTVFGQSDGATGAGLQMTAYGGKGRVPMKRAIMMSGSPACDPGVSGNGTLMATNTVARLAGCTGNNPRTVLTCLRKRSYQDLLAAVIKFEKQDVSSQDIFFPTIDNDFIPDAPSQLLRTGRFHKNISVIASWTYNDGSIFAAPGLNASEAVIGFLSASYPALNQTTLQTLIKLYPMSEFVAAAESTGASPYELQAARIYRDINFACPAIDVTHRVKQYSPNTPTYLYEFNTTSFTFLLEIADATQYGVIHTSDILFAFNNSDYGGLLPVTAAQMATQKRFSGSFVRFATTGNPSGTGANAQDTSLTGWTQAYTRPQASNQRSNVQGASVRVVGGPSPGQVELSLSGAMGPEARLLERCAFINSRDVQLQVQT